MQQFRKLASRLWWDENWDTVLALTTVIVIVGALLCVWLAPTLETGNKVQLTTGIGTAALAVGTAVYAWHTRRMAKEVREQRIASSRPCIIQRTVPSGIIATGTDSDHFEIYNAGNGPAIDLELLLLDEGKALLQKERHAFLRAGESPVAFYPHDLLSHVRPTWHLLCQYRGLPPSSGQQMWYRTWLTFSAAKSQARDYVLITTEQMEFDEGTERKSY